MRSEWFRHAWRRSPEDVAMPLAITHVTTIRRLSNLALLVFIGLSVGVGTLQYRQQREQWLESTAGGLQRQFISLQGRLHTQLERHRLQERLVENDRQQFPGCLAQQEQDAYAQRMAIRTATIADFEVQLQRLAGASPARLEPAAGQLPSMRVEPEQLLMTSLQPLGPSCDGKHFLVQRSRTSLSAVLPKEQLRTMYVSNAGVVLLHDRQALLHLSFGYDAASGRLQLTALPLNAPRLSALLHDAEQRRRAQKTGQDVQPLLDGHTVMLLKEPSFGLQALYYSGDLLGDYPRQFLRNNASPIGLLFALFACLLLVRLFIGHMLDLAANYYRASTFDFLTGLYNRRALMTRASAELARAGRNGRPLCLLQLDIDFFKRINDQHGHDAGDEALKLFASVLQASLRQGDIAARMGGEEFLLLLPETDLLQAQSIAARLLARVRAARLDYQGTCIQLTCSIGLARWHGPQDSLKALLNRADALLYQAKQQGRDRAIGEPSRPPAQLPVCA